MSKVRMMAIMAILITVGAVMMVPFDDTEASVTTKEIANFSGELNVTKDITDSRGNVLISIRMNGTMNANGGVTIVVGAGFSDASYEYLCCRSGDTGSSSTFNQSMYMHYFTDENLDHQFGGTSSYGISNLGSKTWRFFVSDDNKSSSPASGTNAVEFTFTIGKVTRYDFTTSLAFNANGGSNAPATATNTGYTIGSYPSGIDTLSVGAAPVRDGYIFLGYSTTQSGNPTYQPGGKVAIDKGEDVTLYAQWEIETYKLYLMSEGQVFNTVNVPKGSGAIIPASIPAKAGHEFVGWSESQGSSTADYYAGDSITVSEDTSLYAVWQIAETEFILTYDANGGSNAPDDQSSGPVRAFSHTFTIVSAEPTRSGYEFMGWSTTKNGSVEMEAGDRITLDTTTDTLYAVWQEKTVFTIAFNANGGSNAPSSVTGSSIQSAMALKVPSTEPTRSGYEFMGWSTDRYATSATFQAGDTVDVTASQGTVTLYAVWKEITDYSLVYNANGGSNAPSTQSRSTTASSVTMTVTSSEPYRNGYELAGWSTNSSATTATLMAGDNVVLTSDSPVKTLYAVWEQIIGYTLSFHANGGSNAPSALNHSTTDSTWTFTIPSKVLTRSGYTHVGWSTSASATVSTVAIGSSYTLASDEPNVTLYAVWKKDPVTFTLHFDASGGSGSPETMVSVPVNSSTYTFTLDGTIPTKTGFRFLGWSETQGSTSAQYARDSQVTVDSLSTTLYAVWKQLTVYTLSFHANGGSNAPSSVIGYSDTGSCVVSVPSAAPTPPTDHGFVGWSTTQDGDATIEAGSAFNMTSTNVTLYAVYVWVTEMNFRLVYDVGTGSNAPTTQTIDVQAPTATTTVSDKVPVLAGHIFLGWTDTVGGSLVYEGGEQIVLSSPVTTLYAVWKAENAYALIYDANGGSNAPVTQTGSTVEGSWTFTVTSSEPTRSGFEFMGWSTTSNGPVEYVSGDGVTLRDTSKTVTLYAVWTQIYDYVLTYDANGGTDAPAVSRKSTTDGSWTFTVTSSEPTRSGFEFMGWSTTSTGAVTHSAGDGITLASDSPTRILYAVWVQIYDYVLTYDANGGTDAPAVDRFSTIDLNHGFTVTSSEPARSGFEFMGWSTTSVGPIEYTAGHTIRLTSSSPTATLFAVWAEVITYTIQFNVNEGLNPPTAVTGTSHTGSCQIQIPLEEPTRAEYEFLGWSTSTNATVPDLVPGQTFTASMTEMILFAVWKAHPQVSISVEPNTVVIVGSPVEIPVRTTPVSDVTVSGPLWLVLSDGTLRGTAPTTPGTFEVTLTATCTGHTTTEIIITVDVQSQEDTVKVSYLPNGGTMSNTVHYVLKDGKLTAPVESPVRDGYQFLGWFTQDGVAYDFGTTVTGDLILVAHWGEPEEPVSYAWVALAILVIIVATLVIRRFLA